MVLCFAPGCDHTSEKSSCKFYRFPKNSNLASKWESRCLFYNQNESQYEVKLFDRRLREDTNTKQPGSSMEEESAS